MKLLSPLIALFQGVFLVLWLVFWITVSGLAAILTLNGEVPLMMARRFWAPMHWRITGSPLLVEPLPDIDWSKPHIFLMNHQSAVRHPRGVRGDSREHPLHRQARAQVDALPRLVHGGARG